MNENGHQVFGYTTPCAIKAVLSYYFTKTRNNQFSNPFWVGEDVFFKRSLRPSVTVDNSINCFTTEYNLFHKYT